MFAIYLLNHFCILIYGTPVFKICYLFNNIVVYHNFYPLYVVLPRCHWFCFCTRNNNLCLSKSSGSPCYKAASLFSSRTFSQTFCNTKIGKLRGRHWTWWRENKNTQRLIKVSVATRTTAMAATEWAFSACSAYKLWSIQAIGFSVAISS